MSKFKGFVRGVNLGGWLSQCGYEKEHLETFITEKDLFSFYCLTYSEIG